MANGHAIFHDLYSTIIRLVYSVIRIQSTCMAFETRYGIVIMLASIAAQNAGLHVPGGIHAQCKHHMTHNTHARLETTCTAWVKA